MNEENKLVATLGRCELFWDTNRKCYFINRDGDLVIDALQKDQIIDAWFEATQMDEDEEEQEKAEQYRRDLYFKNGWEL